MLTQQIRERGFSKIRSLRVLRATHLRPETLARAVALPARGSHAREGVGIQRKDTRAPMFCVEVGAERGQSVKNL